GNRSSGKSTSENSTALTTTRETNAARMSTNRATLQPATDAPARRMSSRSRAKAAATAATWATISARLPPIASRAGRTSRPSPARSVACASAAHRDQHEPDRDQPEVRQGRQDYEEIRRQLPNRHVVVPRDGARRPRNEAHYEEQDGCVEDRRGISGSA